MDNEDDNQEINTDDDIPDLINSDGEIVEYIPGLLNSDGEIIEETNDNVRNILQTYFTNLMEEFDSIIEYPKHTYIKENEPLTIIYTEEEQLILPSIVVVDYNNKYDLNYIINSTDHSLFIEKYAIDFSRYIRDNIIPDYIIDYMDEIDGIENTPICKEGFEKIKSVKYVKDENKLDKCQICLDEFNEISDIVNLDCGHVFCDTCIKTYLKTYNNICPLCRKEIDKKEEKIVDENEIDMRLVAYTFMTKYCERCNDCPKHKNRNNIIDLYMANQGLLDLNECIKLIKD